MELRAAESPPGCESAAGLREAISYSLGAFAAEQCASGQQDVGRRMAPTHGIGSCHETPAACVGIGHEEIELHRVRDEPGRLETETTDADAPRPRSGPGPVQDTITADGVASGREPPGLRIRRRPPRSDFLLLQDLLYWTSEHCQWLQDCE